MIKGRKSTSIAKENSTGTGFLKPDIIQLVFNNNVRSVSSALDEFPDLINEIHEETGNTSLQIAVLLGNVNMVQFLISQPNLFPFHKNKRGKDALDIALTNSTNQIQSILFKYWSEKLAPNNKNSEIEKI